MSNHNDDFQAMFGRPPAFPIPADINDATDIAFGYGDAMDPASARPIDLSGWTVGGRIRYRIGARLAFGYKKATDERFRNTLLSMLQRHQAEEGTDGHAPHAG